MVNHIHTKALNVRNTCPLWGLCVVDLFLPVGGALDHQMEKVTWLWRIEVLDATCGEGNGTPLQYSCLENPMDGGAWWAAVYGVAQSPTRLKQLSRCHLEQNLQANFEND